MINRFILSILLLCSLAIQVDAYDEVPIWEGLAPGTENRKNEEFTTNERPQKIYQPSLSIHLPPRELATGAAVLICPGGGYHHLAMYKEGYQTADWLNTLGVAAFVLKYRLDKDEALQDAQQAMKFIRSHAEEWAIDPKKLGAAGFSAGAHLVMNLVANSEPSTRPDFLILMYPGLYDIEPEDEFNDKASPTFLVVANDDTIARPDNTLRTYNALYAANVPTEMHIFEQGGHGFGLGRHRGNSSAWTSLCETWLDLHGLLSLP